MHQASAEVGDKPLLWPSFSYIDYIFSYIDTIFDYMRTGDAISFCQVSFL